MHYILFYDVVDHFPDRRTPYRGAHLEAVKRSHANGELVLAGALTEPPDGAVLVFRGDSPAVAESFAKADPYVLNGLVTTWRVRSWNTVVGDGASLPTLT